jgi:hypothetical protein
MVKASMRSYSAMGADGLHKRYLPAEIESDHHTVVSSRNFEPDALAPSMNSTERLDRLFALIFPTGWEFAREYSEIDPPVRIATFN